MGRDKVIKQIQNKAKRWIVIGILGVILNSLLTMMVIVGSDEDKPCEPEVYGIFAGLAVISLIIAIIAIVKRNNPMSARCIKKNPKLFEQLDELFSDIIYQDDNIIYSNKIIADVKNLTQIGKLGDVIKMSEDEDTYNTKTTYHSVHIDFSDHRITLKIYKTDRAKVDKIEQDILAHCPKVPKLEFNPKIN